MFKDRCFFKPSQKFFIVLIERFFKNVQKLLKNFGPFQKFFNATSKNKPIYIVKVFFSPMN
jgi:hypothetical protein